VIATNKRAGAGSADSYEGIMRAQKENYTHFFAEASVCAGLPLLSTIKGLVESGDRVKTIEGVMSTTLGYIFSAYDGTQKFSELVAECRKKGIVEPDPRDDLSGMDTARKVCILARECGVHFEDSGDIERQSLVPAGNEANSVEEFLGSLGEMDRRLAVEYAEATKENKVLRYVGVVDVENGTGSVELRRYPTSHPFATCNGMDNIISLRTQRYDTTPMTICGPGSGPDVTAGGIFCDILRLTSYLGANT
jgi:aspartokinase/homoserine dehydrogenase 1